MGTIKHNAIVVTDADYAMDKLELVHKKAQELFSSLVSPIIKSNSNGYQSFFVAPDGSKEGWEESNEGIDKEKSLKTSLILLHMTMFQPPFVM